MEAMKDLEKYDKMGVRQNSEILDNLNKDEIVYFSGNVTKFNRMEWKQERLFLVTNLAVYNIKKTKVQRKIPIKFIDGITKSTDPKWFEFVIHVEVEYDYRFVTTEEKRDGIIFVLKHCYFQMHKRNLNIYGVAYPHLKDFTTSKKDALKKISKKPPRGNILKLENLFDESNGKRKISADIAEVEEKKSIQESEDIDIPFEERKSRVATGTIYCKEVGKEITLEDFEIKKVIGKGTFGKVYLVEKKDDKQIYAMKSIRKDVMIENDQIESAKMEKQILLNNEHPFLVKMSYVFQTEQKVYFVMNFIRGGELFTHLNNEKRFSEDKARFYAIQIMLAIGYLHKMNVIYRDIKPENILMNEDGYLFLADFGLAKTVKKGEFATTFWGTPEYLAPEIVKEQGHNFAVDWWAWGILIYEMIVGFPPFFHKNQNTMYHLIEKFQVKFPDPVKHGIEMSEEVQDIIMKLLEKDPTKRLGSERDIDEILEHDWFKWIDIDKLLNKELLAPFIPVLTQDLEDVSNFDKEFTSESLTQSIIPKADMRAVYKYNDKFTDFDK